MSFFKSLLNIVNPLPAIINANKVSGQSLGDKLLNIVNPAQAQIKANTGQTALQLSPEYKALTSGQSVLTQSDIDNAKSGVYSSDVANLVATTQPNVNEVVNPTDNNKTLLIAGAVAIIAIFIMKK